MEERKLTPGPWGVSASQFEQIKDLLVRWMKSAPTDDFIGCDEAPCLEDNENAWKYKPRYIKTCYLRGLRELGHISEIPYYLSFVNHCDLPELLVTFLCSKTAMKNAGLVQPLIDYIDNDEHAMRIASNYEELLRGGLEKLYWFDPYSHEKKSVTTLFQHIKPEERLHKVECYHMLEPLYSFDSDKLLQEGNGKISKKALSFRMLKKK